MVEREYFPTGTVVGEDLDGRDVHVGDVIEHFWNDYCGTVRGVVEYDAERGEFKAWGKLDRTDGPSARGAFRPAESRIVFLYTDPHTADDLLPHGGTRYAASPDSTVQSSTEVSDG